MGEFIMALVETLEVWDMAESSEHLRLDWTDCSDLIEPYPSVLLVQLLSLLGPLVATGWVAVLRDCWRFVCWW